MAKLTLSNLTSLTNQGTAIGTINTNSTAITTAMENTLSRDGTTPNTMTADLDMNSNSLLNVAQGTTDSDVALLGDIGDRAVLYSEAQSLTNAEQTIARNNIGAGSAQTITGVTLFNSRNGIVVPASGDYTATQITNTPAGGVAAVTVQAAITELDTEKANLASPTFTGVPAAPTAAAATNTTQIATTAFATTADNLKANLASPTFTGTPVAPTASAGTNTTQLATTAFVGTALTATRLFPQGRLTLVTLTPVMTTTQSAKTTIFYTPYVGQVVPIYDGTNMIASSIGTEISVATNDATKSPAAIGASKVNDWFVWNDSGTIRLGHGPDWTNDTTRSAGTALTMVNGILLNNALITNGPAASRGTYVGTTRSNASNQLDWIYGGFAASSTAGFFGLWNAYNRVDVATMFGDTTSSWPYTLTTLRAMNASNTARVSMVRGLDIDAVVFFNDQIGSANASGSLQINIGLDSTSGGVVGTAGFTNNSTATQPMAARYGGLPGLGFHFLSALESSPVGSPNGGTFFGTGGIANFQTGCIVELKA